MILKRYVAAAAVLLLALALFLFPELRSWLGSLSLFVLIAGCGVLALAPIIIAKHRRHRNYWPIVVLTFICWPVALVWSLTDGK